jgi:predicted lipoprotein with Yx(FWY)xxD motif
MTSARVRAWRALALGCVGIAAVAGAVAAASGLAVAAGSRTTVHLAREPGVGEVLVDSGGRTLYVFSKDKAGKPKCTSKGCVAVWPPLTISSSRKPTCGAGLKTYLLGTVKDPDGKLQVTYNHRPLYRFSGDGKPGDVNGQGLESFGGRWTTVNAKGKPVTGSSGTTTTTSWG